MQCQLCSTSIGRFIYHIFFPLKFLLHIMFLTFLTVRRIFFRQNSAELLFFFISVYLFANIKTVKPPPPPQKSHFIIKTTKYGKGHGLFDWKHNLHKQIKHVFFKKPNHIVTDDIIAPPTIDSIGLLPPPR